MQSDTSSFTSARIKRLGSYLIEAGLLTQTHIDVALADQEATGMRFGDILVVRGWIKEKTIEYLMEKVILPERNAAARKLVAHPEMQQDLPWEESPLTKQKFLFDATFWENDSWVD